MRSLIACLVATLLVACEVYTPGPAYQPPPPRYSYPPPSQPPPPQYNYPPPPRYGDPPPQAPPPQYPPPAPYVPPPTTSYYPPPQTNDIYVPADRAEPVYAPALGFGERALLEVSGVFSCWGDRQDGVDGAFCYATWRCATPEAWGQLLVDDVPITDLIKAAGQTAFYNPEHVYRVGIAGTGRPIKLQIADAKGGSWGDNHNGLTVRVLRGAAPPAGGLSVRVPSDRAEAVYSAPLAPGREYLLEVSGEFSCWGDHQDGVDAMYCYATWRCASPEVWGQLLVDDVAISDLLKAAGGAPRYSPNHVYAIAVRGTGRPLKLQIADAKGGSWGDNHGALDVRLTPR